MIRAHLLTLSSAFALTACTTATSFAPPPVSIRYSGDLGDGATCPAGGRMRATVTVSRDVQGTFNLVDTFIAALRCSAHASANGRQAFEIPAFLATTGAAAAVALGGGATYGIIGTSANALFNAGKSYWDPKAKAAIYDHALDAMLCIKTEAVGIAAYKFDNAAREQAANMMMFESGNKPKPVTVGVTPDQQYFMMVSAAAFSVERILAQRLSNMASVDASAVAAELIAAAEEARKQEAARDAANKGEPAPAPGDGNKSLANALFEMRRAAPKQEVVRLDLAVLKPKLDECVIRAKL